MRSPDADRHVERAPGARSRDLLASLALLGVVVAIALGSLALDENWWKLARVALAASAYAALLLAGGRTRARGDRATPPRFRVFLLAGGCAGLLSGVVRPAPSVPETLALAVLGATLLGGLHWLALRRWRTVRERLMPEMAPAPDSRESIR